MSFLTITDKRNGLRRAAGVTLLLDKTLAANKEKREQVKQNTEMTSTAGSCSSNFTFIIKIWFQRFAQAHVLLLQQLSRVNVFDALLRTSTCFVFFVATVVEQTKHS